MILHPSIIALYLSSFISLALLLYSCSFAAVILRKWDIGSGSELQLSLERRTYLISVILSYLFFFQLLSLFLFIYTADNLHNLFSGAMCAAGTLNVNQYGYPVLVLKIVNFILAGTWLIINRIDIVAHDYPLIKKKYSLLLFITPFMAAETALQTSYFTGLNADVITSCCGSLFSSDATSITSEIASFPSLQAKTVFYISMVLTFGSGIFLYYKNRGGFLFSILSLLSFVISVSALISFISLYYYELPTHHCPFCILQSEYGYAGYYLYLTLLCGVVTGAGAGIAGSFSSIGSLAQRIPVIQKRLILVCLSSYGLFVLIVTLKMIFSDFILEGY
ncbi:MAG: hypothetical protein EPN22_05300 [Nitrospirae bacterium]|nr:MAG: hypothetical protein EPN22_05300 [Nitrospirota bacterium]